MSYGHLAEGDGTAHSANGIRGSGLRREGGWVATQQNRTADLTFTASASERSSIER